ncbi:50S ribosomal protein L29 [Candidatus Parcubacteria bacterium]|nr:50S ribosomal protein L29 [Candidatus Parcubacteria bacterium]
MDEKKLRQELEEARTRLKELTFKNAASQLKQIRQIRETKKAIARLLTRLAN